MPTPRVIDISHHNVIPVDLTDTKAAGILGVIHKCTEGKSYVDSKVQARHFLTLDAGLKWGMYHFLRPGDMKQQANFFYDTAMELGVLDDDTLLAADHEDPGVSYNQLLDFLQQLEMLSSRVPVIYSGHVLKDQCAAYPDRYRLWLAQYASKPTLPPGCEQFYMWQYTDTGSIPGLTPPTDLNSIDLPVEEFLAKWSGMETLEPVPETDTPLVQLAVLSDRPIRLRLEVNQNITIEEGDT